jgi:hypothetical protein
MKGEMEMVGLIITNANKCPSDCEHYDNYGNGGYQEYCYLPNEGTFHILVKDGKLVKCPLGKWDSELLAKAKSMKLHLWEITCGDFVDKELQFDLGNVTSWFILPDFLTYKPPSHELEAATINDLGEITETELQILLKFEILAEKDIHLKENKDLNIVRKER